MRSYERQIASFRREISVVARERDAAFRREQIVAFFDTWFAREAATLGIGRAKGLELLERAIDRTFATPAAQRSAKRR